MYETTTKSLRAMAEHFGCSIALIRNRARQGGWTRSDPDQPYKPTQFIRDARAEIAPGGALVAPAVFERARRIETSRQVIEAYSDVLLRVKREHRSDLQRFRDLSGRLFDELEAVDEGRDALLTLPQLLIACGALESGSIEATLLRGAVRAATSLPNRVATLDKLVRVLDTTIRLEREALDFDRLPPGFGDEGDPLAAPDRSIRFVAPDGTLHDSAASLVESMPGGLWVEVDDHDDSGTAPAPPGTRFQ